MNLQTSITHFRRQIQEVTEDQFSDADIIQLLNAGLNRLQGDIQAVDPFAFVVHDIAHIVEDQELYPWPAGFNYELALWQKETDGDLYTTRIWPADFEDARGNRIPQSEIDESPASGFKYYRHGDHFGLSPIPGEDQDDGLLLMSVETLTMTELTDVCRVKIPLHWAYVLYAKVIALGETGEKAAEVYPVLNDLIAKIPNYYQKPVVPSVIAPTGLGMRKGYGRGPTRSTRGRG